MTREQAVEQARKMWQFMPFRRCFVAEKTGEQTIFILKPTAHFANKLAREGWTVLELHRASPTRCGNCGGNFQELQPHECA